MSHTAHARVKLTSCREWSILENEEKRARYPPQLCRGSPLDTLQSLAPLFRLQCHYKVVVSVTFETTNAKKSERSWRL